MRKRIVDAHSHIGIDRFFKFQGNILEYAEKCKEIGITDSLLMSTPCPVIFSNGKKIVPLIWEYNGQSFDYYQEVINEKKMPAQENPYYLTNMILQSSIKQVDDENIRLYFVPLVHPIYDTQEYLEMLFKDKPIAVKMHGISAAFSPYNISNEFWNLLRKYDIPVIVHTDYDNTEGDTALAKLRNMNCPLDWIKVLSNKGVRALLTHGVRLCEESCTIVNQSNKFIVGIGPDSLIASEKERLYRDGDYLKTLISMVDIEKLVFDIDYPWNLSNNHLDFNSINRIKEQGLSNNDLDKILYQNAIKFFKI